MASRNLTISIKSGLLPLHGQVESGYRLDFLANPYAPDFAQSEAPEWFSDEHTEKTFSMALLQSRLATRYGLAEEWISCFPDYQSVVSHLIGSSNRSRRFAFQPSEDVAPWLAARASTLETLTLSPDVGMRHESAVSGMGIVWLQSPHNPSGSMIGVQALVERCNEADLVVVDERYGEHAAWSVIPFIREFNNLVVIRSFEFWGGLTAFPVCVLLTQPGLMEGMEKPDVDLSHDAIVSVHAALDNASYLRATLDELRREKHRMFRMLRKSNLIRPIRSGAHFQLATIERGCRDEILDDLSASGCHVFSPTLPGYEHSMRISALHSISTRALQRALQDAGRSTTSRVPVHPPEIALR